MIFERYIFKNLLISTVLTTIILAVVILLTQSLRFLELIINSGASGATFGLLTLLALPRFFEIILPLALMASIFFVYNRMIQDRELTVMRALGSPPLNIAKPALILAMISTVFLWFMTSWAAPVSLSSMQHLRQVIKAQYSSFLFREGVFNNVRPGLTVFIRSRDKAGEMSGLLIHDSRDKNDAPVTVMAKTGHIVTTDDGQQVLVYKGSRQNINPKTGVLDRLEFDRYTIDLPSENAPVRQRWREPDERTLFELLYPDLENKRDRESQREFMVEAHRRIVSPLLAPTFAVLALCVLLVGPLNRKGQGARIALGITLAIIIQGFYLAGFNLARHSNIGLFLMYFLAITPLVLGLAFLGKTGEKFRRRVLYLSGRKAGP